MNRQTEAEPWPGLFGQFVAKIEIYRFTGKARVPELPPASALYEKKIKGVLK